MSRQGRRWLALVAVLGVGAIAACVPPKALPLRGTPTGARIPSTELPPGHQKVLFRWRYQDPDIEAVGAGAARVAAPDSVRLDFIADHGMGGGYALLFDDTLVAPGAAGAARRYLPPKPLLWAALGRLAVPPAPDTIVRLDGDTLRADIGSVATLAVDSQGRGTGGSGTGPVWRAAFVDGRLVALARLSGGRVREFVTRKVPVGACRASTDPATSGAGDDGGVIRYNALTGQRTLMLTRVRCEAASGFDAEIWRARR